MLNSVYQENMHLHTVTATREQKKGPFPHGLGLPTMVPGLSFGGLL